jgi:crossover junction endodeoxyribonuclease RusA
MPVYTFQMPYPPLANRYWRNFRGRMVLSPEAREYRARAAYDALSQGIRPIDGPVAVIVDVYRPRRRGDLDGALKCLLDTLQGVAYENDAQIVDLHARRFDDKANPRVVVTVSEAAP